jgi:hypothetical protein
MSADRTIEEEPYYEEEEYYEEPETTFDMSERVVIPEPKPVFTAAEDIMIKNEDDKGVTNYSRIARGIMTLGVSEIARAIKRSKK